MSPRDPRRLAVFYVTLAAVVIGFLGAVQLSVHVSVLKPAERGLHRWAILSCAVFWTWRHRHPGGRD